MNPTPGATVAGNNADFCEAFCKQRAFAGNADIAHQCEITAGAVRGTIDRGDAPPENV
jgi:hypothetical protein